MALFKTMADERLAVHCRVIGRQRAVAPIESTTELAKLVSKVYAQKGLGDKQRIHPATRSLPGFAGWLSTMKSPCPKPASKAPQRPAGPGARAAIAAFHSVEDRVVNSIFGITAPPVSVHRGYRKLPVPGPALYLKPQKPIVPGPDEIEANVQAEAPSCGWRLNARPLVDALWQNQALVVAG
ncbi:MAG: 16S rRNA (cytosine(1402)-N(4))-methyltransferase [Vampirovibrionales bacterium]